MVLRLLVCLACPAAPLLVYRVPCVSFALPSVSPAMDACRDPSRGSNRHSLLRRVAERLQATVRPTDSVYRYGGEEIAVLLRHGTEGARAVAARLVSEVAALDIPNLGRPHRVVTISAGLAWERPPGVIPHDLIERVDMNFYAVKSADRNRWIAEAAPDVDTEGQDGTGVEQAS